MKQYAVIGASTFGKEVLESLILLNCEIILIDKDPEIIEYFKNDVTAAYIANVINREIVVKMIPADIDAVIVDLGDKIEASILVTQYLDKLGVGKIIVKAETDPHGEILSSVGADHVVFPNSEAAKRITPLLVSRLLFNYMPLSGDLVMAETAVPSKLCNHRVLDLDIRQAEGINVIAMRKGGHGEYQIFNPEYRLQKTDILLIVGREEDVMNFSGRQDKGEGRGVGVFFRKFFS